MIDDDMHHVGEQAGKGAPHGIADVIISRVILMDIVIKFGIEDWCRI